MTDTIGTNGSTRLSSRACGHSHGECHVACAGTVPLREYCGPPDQIRPGGETGESGTTDVHRAVRSPDLGETPTVTVVPHEPVHREITDPENLLAAAERKAADQTALATRALSLQQKEWRRAEALAANNQRLQDAYQALRRELDTAREETTAERIRTCRLDYQLSTLREQYVVELRRLHEEAAEQVRTLRAELTAAGKEVSGLRAALSGIRDQAGFTNRQARTTDDRTRIADEPARGVRERAWDVRERTRRAHERAPHAREQVPFARDRSGPATSPGAGRHRRRAPSHRSNGRGLWSGPRSRSSGLSWMRSRPTGISCPGLASIVAWLIRLR
ncbi:hypothetical protein ACLQ2R_08200 [Streptosporangium sp. DT93]|uniref:hypothetical protein n=1 Tax=Streptosporangium sp. DT93 TaxID=3393428 RepID=UPI003CE9D69B